MTTIWNWLTALIGVAVIVLTYINEALLADYFDAHAIFNNSGLSGLPSLGLGALGFILIVGGAVAALRGRHRVR